MKKIIGIYKITSPTGKVYIGQSRNVLNRWKQYEKDSRGKKNNRKVLNSIVKHGFERHVFEIAHELPIDVDQAILNEYEQLYIDLYRKCGVELMNLREAGHNGLYSEESRMKMRMSQLGKKSSPETIAKRRAKVLGSKRTDEAKRKISMSNKGKVRTDDCKKRMSEAKKGVKMSDESNVKKSKALIGRKLTDDHRAKISASHKNKIGRPVSNVTKLKMSIAQKGRKVSPESVIKSAISRTGQKRTLEQRERMRQSALKYQERKKMQNAV